MSKKLCIVMIGIQAVVHLSQDEPNKIYYAGLIAFMVATYKLVQMRIDVIRTKYGVNKTDDVAA